MSTTRKQFVRLLAAASALAFVLAALPVTLDLSPDGPTVKVQSADAKKGRGKNGDGQRGRDRDRDRGGVDDDDGTPDQGPGDAPGTPGADDNPTPGDDDGTPDQGPGDN